MRVKEIQNGLSRMLDMLRQFLNTLLRGSSRSDERETHIAERKRVEGLLEASEVRFRRLFEASQDGILLLDRDSGQITEVNPFLLKMLGYSRDELLQRKLWEVGAFRDAEETKAAFDALQRTGYVRYEDIPLETKDGRLIDVEFVSNVYSVDHQRVIQCNIRDITERKRAEEAQLAISREREKHVEELEQLNQIMMDREARILELKEEVRVLRQQLANQGPARSMS